MLTIIREGNKVVITCPDCGRKEVVVTGDTLWQKVEKKGKPKKDKCRSC